MRVVDGSVAADGQLPNQGKRPPGEARAGRGPGRNTYRVQKEGCYG